MVITRRCIFTLLFQGTCFGSLFRSHFQAELYFLAIYNSTVNCIHFLLKKIESSLKMVSKGAETCRWKSSSLTQQPLLGQGLLQMLLPSVPIPCSIPPNFSPPTSSHLPSHHLPISVSACPAAFFLLPLQPELFL